jgi:hypothetical protein
MRTLAIAHSPTWIQPVEKGTRQKFNRFQLEIEQELWIGEVMTEEVKSVATDEQSTQAENKANATPPGAASSSRTAPAPNRWTTRAAEIKKQKRRAHRRKINASNTPG